MSTGLSDWVKISRIVPVSGRVLIVFERFYFFNRRMAKLSQNLTPWSPHPIFVWFIVRIIGSNPSVITRAVGIGSLESD